MEKFFKKMYIFQVLAQYKDAKVKAFCSKNFLVTFLIFQGMYCIVLVTFSFTNVCFVSSEPDKFWTCSNSKKGSFDGNK